MFFSLSTALVISYTFWCYIFIWSSLIQSILVSFENSSLTCGWSRSALLDFQVMGTFLVFLFLVSSLISLWLVDWHWIISLFFFNLLICFRIQEVACVGTGRGCVCAVGQNVLWNVTGINLVDNRFRWFSVHMLCYWVGVWTDPRLECGYLLPVLPGLGVCVVWLNWEVLA